MDQSYAGMHGKLPSRVLHPLKHLQLLTLTRSGIRSIPSNAFHGLRRLQVDSLCLTLFHQLCMHNLCILLMCIGVYVYVYFVVCISGFFHCSFFFQYFATVGWVF